jgi:hypothetical protein
MMLLFRWFLSFGFAAHDISPKKIPPKRERGGVRAVGCQPFK